ncbi:MAG TPA: SA1362 family protein [Pseudogracilibacillus sp.]|nr:SA1362 family protein [Pseudogracilibacillus sp.]
MKRLPIVIYFIFGFAIVGLISSLIRRPSSFLLSIFVAVLIGFVIYFILTSFLDRQRGGSSDEMRKYRRAVKRSQQKYRNPGDRIVNNRTVKKQTIKRRRPRRRVNHLTVIEGKKSSNSNDKKNRASH